MEYGDWDVLMKTRNVNDKSQVSGLHHSDTSQFRPKISIRLSRHSVWAQNTFRVP